MSDETKRPRPGDASTQPPSRAAAHPIGTPKGLSSTSGILAPAAWLAARGLFVAPDKPWHATMSLSCAERVDTKLCILIRHDAWCVRFTHGSRSSEVCMRDMLSVENADDHGLMGMAPTLKDLSVFVRELERRYGVRFQRAHATIDTSIPGAEPIIRAWIVSL